jgi:hypothetical protein
VAAKGRRGVLIGYQKFFFLPSDVKLSIIINKPDLRRGFKMRFRVYKLNHCYSIYGVVYLNFSRAIRNIFSEEEKINYQSIFLSNQKILTLEV